MALLVSEGFDWLQTADLTAAYGRFGHYAVAQTATETIEETGGRNGLKSYKQIVTGSSNATEEIIGPSFSMSQIVAGATSIFGFAVKFNNDTGAGNQAFVTVKGTTAGDSGMNLQLYRTPTQILTAGRPLNNNNSYTFYAGSSKVLATGVWYFIECKFVPDNSTGSVIVRVNGREVLNVSNIDTVRTDDTYESLILGTNADLSGSNPDLEYDDVYIFDDTGSRNNDFAGDIEISRLDPNGNGNANQWLGSDADSTDNYLHVDDSGNPDDDTSYVEDNVSGQQDLYTYDNLRSSADTVKACVSVTIGRKEDAGGANIKSVCRSNVTETDITLGLSTSYTAEPAIYEIDPNTSTDWTTSGVDSAEFGVEIE